MTYSAPRAPFSMTRHVFNTYSSRAFDLAWFCGVVLVIRCSQTLQSIGGVNFRRATTSKSPYFCPKSLRTRLYTFLVAKCMHFLVAKFTLKISKTRIFNFLPNEFRTLPGCSCVFSVPQNAPVATANHHYPRAAGIVAARCAREWYE